MLDNHTYNLMAQLVEEHKSLWRIKNSYTEETGDCGNCKEFWEDMVGDKEKHIEDMLGMLKDHLNG